MGEKPNGIKQIITSSMTIKALLYINLLLVSFVSLQAQTYDLRYTLEIGKSYKFFQETELNMVQTIGPMEQEVNNSFKGITRFIPTEIKGDSIVLKVAFETMSIQIKSMFFNLLYDSELPVEKTDNIGLMYDGIVNKEFTMVITPKGKVISISGMDAIIEESAEKLIYASTRSLEQIKKTMNGHFGEESLKGNMEMILAIYPDNKQDVGGRWTVDTKLTSSLQANLQSKWTLDSANEGIWELSSVGKISAVAEEAEINGMKMRFNLNGNNESSFTLNQKDGWFEKGWQKQYISGFIEMLATKTSKESIQVPMSLTSSTRLERRE